MLPAFSLRPQQTFPRFTPAVIKCKLSKLASGCSISRWDLRAPPGLAQKLTNTGFRKFPSTADPAFSCIATAGASGGSALLPGSLPSPQSAEQSSWCSQHPFPAGSLPSSHMLSRLHSCNGRQWTLYNQAKLCASELQLNAAAM